MPLQTIRKIFGVKKKILLSVPHTFPHWHSRYGDETGFARKITQDTKIHTVKSAVFFWENCCDKFASGNYRLQVVHLENTPKGKVYYPILQCDHLHMQKAYLSPNPNYLIVEGKPVDIEVVACNEGLERDDLTEFLHKYNDTEFCIVHFTEFRY